MDNKHLQHGLYVYWTLAPCFVLPPTPRKLGLPAFLMPIKEHFARMKTMYSLDSKIVFVLTLDFYVYIQLDVDECRHGYIEYIHKILYESIKKSKRILFWD